MRCFRLFSLAFLLYLITFSAVSAQRVITYHLDPQISAKSIKVTMDIPQVRELTVRAQIPVWSPGAYIVSNYASNISELTAEDTAGKSLRVYHPDQNTWEIAANGAKSIRVHYTVNRAELEESGGVPKRGHVSGPRTYMYVVGRKTEPVALSLAIPSGAKTWNIATSLDPIESGTGAKNELAKPHLYRATSYDVLADSPIEMGDFTEDKFEAAGKPHSVVLYGPSDGVDRPKLIAYCKKIVETETAFFGDAPYHRYIFEFHATANRFGGAGGLEHLGSTEIGPVGLVDDRVRSVIAHEFFHLWNVKRIRPFVLGPFDYVNPPHTANLWWSEGVTSYYGDLLSRRGGLNTDEEYLKHIADTITQLQNNPARLKVSADESSLHVWDANNSQGFGGLSYYTKGELIGLCLDLKIRQLSSGGKNLDDVIRSLYAQCRQGNGPGFAEDGIKTTANHVTGLDLSEFYDRTARSTDELPFEECLGYAGLILIRSDTPTITSETGMTARPDREFMTLSVTDVKPGGTAEKSGLKAGDKIMAVNDQSEIRTMNQLLRSTPAGKKLTLTILRGGSRSDIEYTMGSGTRYNWKVEKNPAASKEQIRLREAWLTGK